MRNFLVICAVLCLAATVTAQQFGTVKGRALFGALNGEGVNRANVTLASVDDPSVVFKIESDADGNFLIQNVPPGEYRISADGGISAYSMFGEKRIKVVPGENPPIEVVALFEGTPETVTVSATVGQSLEEVSKTVNVIDGQEMRDRADFTLVDTLRTIPGFRVQQLGGFGRTASIKSRGLRNQDTAVLLDGIRFRDSGAITGDASPFLSDITLTSVDRIEVLRGSGSSLYGTNAIGGTLDFRTPLPRSGFHGQVSGAAGGLGLGRFRSNLSYGGDKFGINAALSKTAYTDGIDGEDNADNTNFQTRVELNPFSRTNISGRLFVTDAKVRLNVSPDTLGTLPSPATIIDAEEGVNFVTDENDPDSFQRSRFFSGQLHLTQVINSQFTLSGFYQGLDTNRKNTDGPLGPGFFQSAFTSVFGGTIHTANVQGKWTPNGSNTFTGGYEYELEQFRNSGSTPNPGTEFLTRASQQSHTMFAQHLISLLDDQLQLSGGVRAQWFDLGTPRFSETDGPYADRTFDSPPAAYTFDASASYLIRQTGTKLRTHVGNGYRVPSLYERFGTFFFLGNFFPQGNPALEPERSLGIDAGVEQWFAKEKVKASATWFYTKIKDEITYLPTDDFGAPVYYNFDRHFSRGAEFSVDAKATKSTDIFASYTYTNSDVRNGRRTMLLIDSTDRKSFGIPDHQFTLVATQRFEKFWVTFDLLATSSYLAPVFSNTSFQQYTYRFDGNVRGDLTAGYTFTVGHDKYNLRLFGTIENLFDNEYFENGFRTAGINGRAGLSFGF